MALIKCSECGREISSNAQACPHCGNPVAALFEKPSTPAPQINNAEEEFNKYLMLARRAKEDNNSENAAKYYDLALQKNPLHWESAFYQVYYTAMSCKIGQIASAGNSVTNCLDGVFGLIKDNLSERADVISAIQELSGRCAEISSMLYTAALNHYTGIGSEIQSNYTQEMLNNCCAARDIEYTFGNLVEKYFSDISELHACSIASWKQGIISHNGLMRWFAQKESNKNIIMEYVSKIQKYDSSYQAPEINTSSGGCYVATCVYGSYDCPEVWTLRRFRDDTLAASIWGRMFIRTYYAVSPTIVKWFGDTQWFKKMWRGKLDKMVAKLHAEGVDDTPYNDKAW